MLSMLAIGSSPKSHQYYVEYAQECGEPQGYFFGRGAEELGLKWNVVESDQMAKLLQGYSPDGNAVCKNAGKHHRGGWDATFSAPKSVSIVWSSADAYLRKQVEAAQDKAVRTALQYLEENAAHIRLGKGGYTRLKAKIVAAVFEHGSSRAGEPQLHTHAIVFNVAKAYRKNEWRTLESRDFYTTQLAASSFYKVELAFELRKLGFSVTRTKDSFEIVGVPESVCEAQSSRSKQIKAQLEKAGFSLDIASARAKELSALQTRPEKDRLGRDFERWQIENAHNGFSQSAIESIRSETQLNDSNVTNDELSMVVRKLTEQDSTFAFYSLDRAIAESQIGHSNTEEVKRLIAKAKEDKIAVEVGTGKNGEKRYSTNGVIELEREIVATLERRAFETGHVLENRAVTKILKSQKTLSSEQRFAVESVTRHPGGIQFIEGQAGTGKSTTLGVVKSAYEKAGYELVGLSFTNKAARNLKTSSGIKSQSVDSFLLKQQNKLTIGNKTVIVVDEAGMLDSRKTLAISKLCEDSNAKLIFVGDAKQIQPIQAGQPFETQQKRFITSRLSEVFRQKLDWERQAVSELRNGSVVKALCEFEKHKQLFVLATPKVVRARIVKDWFEHIRSNPANEAVIVCSRNTEVSKLNELAREKLKSTRMLTSGISFQTKSGEAEFSVGDRIIFTANLKPSGIYNSTLAQITSVSKTKICAKTETGANVMFNPTQFQNFRHGYAITAHKSQGSTVDRAFVYADGFAMDRQKFYVAVSRGRKGNTIYADRTSFREMSMDDRRAFRKLSSKTEKFEFLRSHWRKELAGIVGISHQKDTTQDYSKARLETPLLSKLVEKLKSLSAPFQKTKSLRMELEKIKHSVAQSKSQSQRQAPKRSQAVTPKQ